MLAAVFVAHAAATWFMVGLIWFVQLVHYPLFGGVGAAGFERYALDHQRRTTWVVGPAMLIEAATAAVLVLLVPPGPTRWAAVLGAALLGVVWLSTLLLQVPRHTELGRGYDPRAHRRLVATNWLRTAGWSARGALVIWLAVRLVA